VITVRPVLTEGDIDTYVAVRTRVHPDNPMPRDVVVEDRKKPDQLDLLAERDGEPVGAASVAKFGGAPEGEFAYVTIRVVSEHRRAGVGTMLHLRASEHARGLGKSRFYAVVRDDDEGSRGYYAARGYEELSRMQDVVLDLADAGGELSVPPGIELVPAAQEYDRGAYEVALEADADIPSGEPIRSGSFETWHARHFDPFTSRELSFVALEDGRVVGYALLMRHTEDTYQHSMTGIARSARGRGIALALKQAQIRAAKAAGIDHLRTQNDLANAPMRRVNEKLGYAKRFEWVHLGGPLLS
jgi:RimJ/RimL family protein N-acetyltransferase